MPSSSGCSTLLGLYLGRTGSRGPTCAKPLAARLRERQSTWRDPRKDGPTLQDYDRSSGTSPVACGIGFHDFRRAGESDSAWAGSTAAQGWAASSTFGWRSKGNGLDARALETIVLLHWDSERQHARVSR